MLNGHQLYDAGLHTSCSGLSQSVSCALLTRDKESVTKCRFVPCSEEHLFVCRKNVTQPSSDDHTTKIGNIHCNFV